MSMSRKNYEAVAHEINCTLDEIKQGLTEGDLTPEEGAQAIVTSAEIARKLALVFEGDNPNFDPSRFLRACGVES